MINKASIKQFCSFNRSSKNPKYVSFGWYLVVFWPIWQPWGEVELFLIRDQNNTGDVSSSGGQVITQGGHTRPDSRASQGCQAGGDRRFNSPSRDVRVGTKLG